MVHLVVAKFEHQILVVPPNEQTPDSFKVVLVEQHIFKSQFSQLWLVLETWEYLLKVEESEPGVEIPENDGEVFVIL